MDIAPNDLADLIDDRNTRVVVISFGFGHGSPPEADLVLDARRHLRNPHHDPAMRALTGLDAAVREHVRATPGARNIVGHAAALASDLLTDVADETHRLVTIAVGCVGGRHRSVALAEEIATELRAEGVGAGTEHRDVTQPVIQR